MSAFRRRTQFAAPFVLSIAACSGGKGREAPPKRYPGPTWHVRMIGPDRCSASESNLGCPEGVMCNPPPPSEIKCPPFPKDQNWTTVTKRQSGACAVLPPDCIDDTCIGAATDCPLAIGEKLPPSTECTGSDCPKP